MSDGGSAGAATGVGTAGSTVTGPAGRRQRAVGLGRTLAGKARGGARRLTWGLADQAVSSLTNFAVGLFVAHSLSPVHFGVFSLAYVTFGVALNISRGLATDPLVVRFSGAPHDEWRAAARRASGTALAVGVATGLCCLVAGLALGGPVGAAFAFMGVVLPGLLLQDAWRYAFFAAGQGRRAFANDLAMGVALVPFMLLAVQRPGVGAFLLAWGGSAAVAALFGLLQTRFLPEVLAVRTWLALQRDLGLRYLLENVSLSGAAQLRLYSVGAIAGLASAGTIRGAEILMGPFLAVLMGVGLFAVPEAARLARRSHRALTLFCLGLGSAQGLCALAWGLFLLLVLPDSVGAHIVGPVWVTASALILPASLSITNTSLSMGASAGLRALGAARRSLRAQLCTSALYLGLGVLGALLGGALGSAWGVATATFLGAGMWWWQLRGGLAEQRSRLAPTTTRGTYEAEVTTA